MNHYPELQRAFKQTAAEFLEQLRVERPEETLYAFLFEISDQSPNAWPIAATEGSLSRLAAKYVDKGYRANDGNHLDWLRDGLRWDAPGDDRDGWYWGGDSIDQELNSLLEQQFDADYDERSYKAVQEVCLAALGELDQAGQFGTGPERTLVAGICNVDNDFESFLGKLKKVNPPSVLSRLREQLRAGEAAWDRIMRPSSGK